MWGVLEKEQGCFCLWSPVCVGLGIVIYNVLGINQVCLFFAESPAVPCFIWIILGVLAGVSCSLLCVVFYTRVYILRLTCAFFVLVALGFQCMFYRTWLLNVNVLQDEKKAVWVQGDIKRLERLSNAQSIRIVLHHVVREVGLCEYEAFPNVTLYIRGCQKNLSLGDNILLKTDLKPISSPTWARGYNFKQRDFYEGIGAKGFAFLHTIVTQKKCKRYRWSFLIECMRENLQKAFSKTLSRPYDSIASALLLGKKKHITPETRAIFVRSGIAHLLAISGLHMSIVAGVVFFAAQTVLLWLNRFSKFFLLHKIAAVLTIFLTFFYLQLSGAFTPAVRAFIMTTVAMHAVLLDRSPFSLRLVAFAALCILCFRPERLFSPSFQLSFAAVTALIAFSDFLRPYFYQNTLPYCKRFFYIPFFVCATSVVAGVATAPFTIYFFNQLTILGVVTNLVAIPLTTFFIMPLGLLFLSFYPFGLHVYVAPFLSFFLQILYQVAEAISAWPLASINVPTPNPLCMPLIVMSGFWLFLWQSALRFWSVPFLMVGFIELFIPDIPDVFMDGEAKVIGFFEHDTKTLWTTSKRCGAFAQKNWLQASGALYHKRMPFNNSSEALRKIKAQGWRCSQNACVRQDAFGRNILFLKKDRFYGQGAFLNQEHTKADVVFAPYAVDKKRYATARVFDRLNILKKGAACVWFTKKRLRVERSPQP